MELTPASKGLWKGRAADTLQYWHQAIRFPDLTQALPDANQPTVALLGYAGDNGVSRNNGRSGAAAGPDSIRQQLGPMAYHLPENLAIWDLGNAGEAGSEMEATQDLITATVEEILAKHQFPVLLGGGHELAFAHGRGVINHFVKKGEKVGVLNLDAHLDLRPLKDGKGHSGSPFWQLSQLYPRQFHYLCLGIQIPANPPTLFATADSLQVEWLPVESFHLLNWDSINLVIEQFLNEVNKVYLTVDLDGFASAFAPGVSAPSPMGFAPDIAMQVIKAIAASGKLAAMDVVELNPTYDQDNSTSKLAARCIEYALRNKFVRSG
jgi:formiminoglutamase